MNQTANPNPTCTPIELVCANAAPLQGSLLGSDPEGSSRSYGLEGAVVAEASFEGLSYDINKRGAYGTFYLNSSNGSFRFQPNSDWNLTALCTSATDSFMLTISDGTLTSSTPLLVRFSDSQEAQVQYVLAGGSTPLTPEATAIWEQALAQASRYLAILLSDPNRDALFADVFGRADTDPATFATNLQALLVNLGGEGLRIAVDLRTDGELNGAFAAYAALGHIGSERIYVNADKLNNGLLDVNLATSALLEEFGHALDRRLNGGADSPGDEGKLFAAELTGVVLTAEQRALMDAEDDTAVLPIEGVQVSVEQAGGPLYWDGTGTSWNAVGSWGTASGVTTDPAAVPGASDDVYFSTLTTAQSINLDADQAANGLYFGAANTAATVIQAGGTNRVLTLGTGGISIASGAGAVTLGSASSGQNVAITLGGGQSWTNDSTNALTISNTVNNGGYLLTSAGSGNTAFAGAIAGSGALTKAGAGTLTLSATNTFSGGLTMGANAGTVIAYTNAGTNVTALGSGAVAIGSGSTLELRSQNTGSNNTVINNTFTGTGLLKLSSAYTSGGNNFLGGINGFSGTVELAYSGSQYNILSGSSSARTSVINAPNATLQIDSGNTDYIGFYGSQTWKDIKVSGPGNAEGFGAIRFDSNSTLTVSGSVSLLGSTTIGTGGGTLNGAITSGAAGTQTLTLGTSNASSGATLSGAIGGGTGAIALVKTQSGTVILGGANTYTGATTISAGTLQIGAGGTTGSLSPSSAITNNGTLAFNRTNTLTQGTDFNSVISGTGAVRQAGSGTLVLNGTNTYSGLTSINSGILKINAANNIGDGSATNTVSMNGGTLESTGNTYNLGTNRAINLVAGNNTIQNGSGVITVDGVISGSGNLMIGSSTVGANVTLTGNNTFAGNVSLPALNSQPFAVLTVTNSGALGVGPKTVTAKGGGEIHLQNNITLAANISFLTSGNGQQNGIITSRSVIYNDSGNNTINGNISMTSGKTIQSFLPIAVC